MGALDECVEDPTCAGVYDYKCDENGYMLCDRDGDVVYDIAESSLVNAWCRRLYVPSQILIYFQPREEESNPGLFFLHSFCAFHSKTVAI